MDGYNRHSMRQFLAPLFQTCGLCGIDCLPPFIVHGTHSMAPGAIEEHAGDYRRVLEAIRDGRIFAADPGIAQLSRLNENLDVLLAASEKGAAHAR